MSSPQEHARALMLAQDYGADAIELNRRLVAADPSDLASRTRLARCLLETGQLEEAEAEYREVLQLDPKSRIAAGGLEAVAGKRRLAESPVAQPRRAHAPRTRRPLPAAVAPPATARSGSALDGQPVAQSFVGFTTRDFTELALCRGAEIRDRFGPRVADFLRRVNALGSSQELSSIREAGRRQLFRASKAEVHVRPAHWHVFNMGGRREPQFNIGMFAGGSTDADCLRIGLGFDLADAGADRDGEAGVREARERFRKFQSMLASPRRSFFLGWMIKENGLVQFDPRPPRDGPADPVQAAEALQRLDPARAEWVFFGKWLSPHQEEHAAILADPVALVRTVDRVFTGLSPLWRTLWE